MNFRQLKRLFSRYPSKSLNRTPLRVGILISGRGSNMEALIKHAKHPSTHGISIATVVSDRPQAPGLQIAEQYGIEAKYLDPGKFKTKLEGESEREYIRYLQAKKVDIICLAGFIRVVKARFLEAFSNRILNIHPSLLPAYPGLKVHQRVLAAGETHTGCTVHFVEAGIDTGRIVKQAKIRIRRRETLSTLSKRVLKQEHQLYWEALLEVASELSSK